MAKSNKCECNWGLGIIAIILLAFGLYFLVAGFISQTGTGALWNWNAILMYALGALIVGFGKVTKYKACGGCSEHSCR